MLLNVNFTRLFLDIESSKKTWAKCLRNEEDVLFRYRKFGSKNIKRPISHACTLHVHSIATASARAFGYHTGGSWRWRSNVIWGDGPLRRVAGSIVLSWFHVCFGRITIAKKDFRDKGPRISYISKRCYLLITRRVW